MPNTTHLPPLLFFPTPTVFSACCLVGLLHPTTSHGVRVVSNTVSLPPHFCDRWSHVPFPHSHLTPSEAFPFTTAVLCHHIHFLLAVTSDPVSSIPMRDLKAFLRCEVRCRSQVFLPTTDPMLPWALFPFKVLPSYSNALLKNSGVHPPRRTFSGHIRFRKCDLDLLPPKWTLSTNVHAHPSGCAADAASRDTIGVETRSHAGLPTKCQPALEFFERPLMLFLKLFCRLRRSPASLLHVLQRSFRYEVALISRVFSVLDRSPLTGCKAALDRIRTGARDWQEATLCERHRPVPSALSIEMVRCLALSPK